jgi:hypothetical protein
MMRRVANVVVLSGVFALAVGCDGPAQDTAANIKQQTQAKLDAMKQLADLLEKKELLQIAGAIEAISSSNLDVAAAPDAAREFVDIYNKRVKGKLKGDDAVQVKMAVDEVEKSLKGK